ncbi:Ribosomal protein L22/L17 [Perkinsela sp. CCAP 1560/4]|nr:Ribosomal protein L22/L17 [Perkinsela sp. CCAP 1560/4]|eukprot:KNH09685.1 Ribosomal protein L22/L17 [Perkinsela sp. CCAP 1560/4]
MVVHYSYTPKNLSQSVRSKVSDLRCHFKNTRNTAHVLRGLTIFKARRLLKDVLARKRCIPFFRHSKHTGRTAQAKEWKTTKGRWPVKSCNALLEILRNLKSNANHKGLESGKDLVITHIAVHRAMKQRRRTYRAHGRIGPYMCSPCHVEICAEKASLVVKKPDSKPLH